MVRWRRRRIHLLLLLILLLVLELLLLLLCGRAIMMAVSGRRRGRWRSAQQRPLRVRLPARVPGTPMATRVAPIIVSHAVVCRPLPDRSQRDLWARQKRAALPSTERPRRRPCPSAPLRLALVPKVDLVGVPDGMPDHAPGRGHIHARPRHSRKARRLGQIHAVQRRGRQVATFQQVCLVR